MTRILVIDLQWQREREREEERDRQRERGNYLIKEKFIRETFRGLFEILPLLPYEMFS